MSHKFLPLLLDTKFPPAARNPDDKILVISSFTSALDICDHHLQSLGIRTTRFQGNMNRKKRDKSLR